MKVENASIMRKQELMFAILKQLASKEIEIIGEGVVEVLQWYLALAFVRRQLSGGP